MGNLAYVKSSLDPMKKCNRKLKKRGRDVPGPLKKSWDFWTSLVPGPQDHGTFKVSRSCPVPSRDLSGTSRDGTVLLESLVGTIPSLELCMHTIIRMCSHINFNFQVLINRFKLILLKMIVSRLLNSKAHINVNDPSGSFWQTYILHKYEYAVCTAALHSDATTSKGV